MKSSIIIVIAIIFYNTNAAYGQGPNESKVEIADKSKHIFLFENWNGNYYVKSGQCLPLNNLESELKTSHLATLEYQRHHRSKQHSGILRTTTAALLLGGMAWYRNDNEKPIPYVMMGVSVIPFVLGETFSMKARNSLNKSIKIYNEGY